jgi:putative transposase
LLFGRGIDICYETVRLWKRFGMMFRRDPPQRIQRMGKWHLDKASVKVDGEMRYLWRAVDRARASPSPRGA